ncbi:sugar phosphate isomerase/epimerase family protein [Tengunoibacter tsumagoiensis]|uniref:Xylose isomerase-like TIM barrel domain-containing protein n=1 Tax=Tengunoibacter tsumagoiensis TaxID=2014871 RepID=A0A401ZYE7_9CHLR|nr:TIM barrel protein [Tengunoibacter tsumagoiensis]GCE11865.1 hypothetical protein KTT_17240 [Tengunoibacter tsumagoiensis]
MIQKLPDNRPLISFMSANFVARQINFQMHNWNEGDNATNAYFQPLETFRERFAHLLQEIHTMGFRAMDLWLAHLHWSWATPQHIAIAQELLAEFEISITSLAGSFGSSPDEFEATCRIAQALGTRILGGSTALLASNRKELVRLLHKYNVLLAIENHPEKNAADMLALIGDGGQGTIGTAVDTGWYGTNGYDAARAIEELGEKVFHVHLKDVLAAGAHDTCRYGRGIVNIPACLTALQQIGYQGDYSVEHEPETFDPTEDCIAMRTMLTDWLTAQ